MTVRLSVQKRSWPTRGSFAISRGMKITADVVVAEISDGAFIGRGECVPYARYGESPESVVELIESLAPDVANGLDRHGLQTKLPCGAARNALDCALWDLESKRRGKRAWELVRPGGLAPLTTAYTLSLDTPELMGENARAAAHLPLLKLKLGGSRDMERIKTVRAGAPSARIIVDANEGWNEREYKEIVPAFAELGVTMIEQPLPAGEDDALAHLPRPIAVCADESCHGLDSLSDVLGKYDMINIKLDKTGGLTEGLALKTAAEQAGLKIMVGCMLATSLAMAPAMVVAQGADVVDLDGPLLLAEDHDNPIQFNQGIMQPPKPELWG